jgi:hypothetical protein
MSAVDRLLTVIVVSTASLLLGSAPNAFASCVTPPATSPTVFTATVLSTDRDGRIARVRTDDGRTIEVRGTPASDGYTSVDRTYMDGTRYEFHPINTTEPFEDNACTATHAVAPLPATTSPTAPSAVPPASAAGPPSTHATAWMITGGGVLAAIAAVVALLGIRLRRRRTSG